jgi:hypothetical protein
VAQALVLCYNNKTNMKNPKVLCVLQYMLVLGLYNNAHAQRSNHSYRWPRRNDDNYPSGVAMSLGANHFFSNQTGFDAWANNLYHKSVLQNPMGLAMDIALIDKNGDAGLHVEGNGPFALLTFYGGIKLCHSQHFCSYLNAEAGFFQANVYNIVPPNYVPTWAQQQHKSYLRYQDGCVGLSLKNMFVSRPNKRGTAFVSSLDVQVDYMPFEGTWQYGYIDHYRHSYSHSYRNSYFNGHRVSGIPAPANLYFSITYSIGFMTKNQTGHHHHHYY